MQETWARSLGWKDPLEKEMVTHFQYSCLGNPMDRETLWAAVHGTAKRLRHDLATEEHKYIYICHIALSMYIYT